jgi:hypothetical protein
MSAICISCTILVQPTDAVFHSNTCLAGWQSPYGNIYTDINRICCYTATYVHISFLSMALFLWSAVSIHSVYVEHRITSFFSRITVQKCYDNYQHHPDLPLPRKPWALVLYKSDMKLDHQTSIKASV